MKILLVDDHVLFRQGLVSLLNAQPDFEVIAQVGTVADAVQAAVERQPDLILMDLSLPDGTGLDATQQILAKQPSARIVILTVHEEDDRLFAALRCGAKGYLLKNVPISKLLSFLRGVEVGEAAISGEMVSRVFNEFARMDPSAKRPVVSNVDNKLTTREMQVLKELTTGASNREIADRLIIAENTVKNHIRNILSKLNLKNRREAARLAQHME